MATLRLKKKHGCKKKDKNYAQDYLKKQTQVAAENPGKIDCTKFNQRN